ncbi:MAG TPA: FAD-dependent oxidoreductase [Gammaproteobacteria bacterium]|nr:FAD-dependent oxidoreductase [Gammaproteobacteria bacterium]
MSVLKTVAIFGGGIAGLTVAHELAERGGFKITVYERRDVFGGKARSMLTKDGFPGEHSIRTVPYFYYQLRDTMRRIPFNTQHVLANVVPLPAGSRRFFLFKNYDPVITPHFFPWNRSGLKEYLNYKKNICKIIPQQDMKDFLWRLFKAICMCDERRQKILGKMNWGEFLDINNKSENFRIYFMRLPEFAVAARDVANARSLAMLVAKAQFFPFIHPIASQHSFLDILNGPSSDVFIDPWVTYLKQQGVIFQTNSTATQIQDDRHKITAITIRNEKHEEIKVTADLFVLAVPIEIMQTLVTDSLKKIAPSLSQLNQLITMPSSGMQFFDSNGEQEAYPRGWTVLMDSPWAILCMYQSKAIWPHITFKQPVKGILSIAWSNFEVPGVLYNKPAKACTAEEIKEEILAQIRMHKGTELWMERMKIHSWHIDPDIQFSKETGVFEKHHAQLFIQPPDSWDYQPDADTEIPNLFLASDYVRTASDIANMESANEAGRRAVNAILKQCKYPGKPCFIVPLPRVGTRLIQWLDRYILNANRRGWFTGSV